MSGYDAAKYADVSPAQVRKRIRSGEITTPTAGMCRGYAQANLVILPGDYANDFREFARKNPRPCPVLEIVEGTPLTRTMAQGADITRDIPKYRIYKDGVLAETVTDASAYWRDDFVGFLIGCSFSFEEALMQAGIKIRHIMCGCNVPMYKTNIMTTPAGPFSGPMVCSMRPMPLNDALLASKITGDMPNVHGAPVHIGDPSEIGIADVAHPDYGDAVEILPGEVPVFWPCGVTPQAAVENARPPIVITHAPGYMFITDIKNDALNAFLEEHKPL